MACGKEVRYGKLNIILLMSSRKIRFFLHANGGKIETFLSVYYRIL